MALNRNWSETQGWKRFRMTAHDHNPVNDAMRNAGVRRDPPLSDNAWLRGPAQYADNGAQARRSASYDRREHCQLDRFPALERMARPAWWLCFAVEALGC